MGNRADREPASPAIPLDTLRKAIDDNAKLVRTIYTAFMGFCLYVAVLAGSTTHEQLLSDKAPKIPLLDIELPIVGIYLVTPLLLLLFHFDLLLQMYFLARTSWQFKDRLDQERLPNEMEVDHLDMLNSSPFVYMLIGEHFGSTVRFLIRTMIGLTVFCAPLIVLLSLQGAFLPYHHPWLHDLHIAVIIADCIIVLFFWHLYYQPPKHATPDTESSQGEHRSTFSEIRSYWKSDNKRAWKILGQGLVPSMPDIGWIVLIWWITLAFVSAFSIKPTIIWQALMLAGIWLAATLVTIFMVDRGRGLARFAFCAIIAAMAFIGPYRPFDGCGDQFFSAMVNDPFWGAAEDSRDHLTGKRPWPIQNHSCHYAGMKLADMLASQSPKLDTRRSGAELRTIASSFYKSLPFISDVRPARVIEYHGSLLKIAETEIQDGVKKTTRKENLGIDLSSRDLRGANLSSAVLYKANLQNANLATADLRNAVLHSAKMQGTILHQADMRSTELQGANLINVKAHGAQLSAAKLHAANLTGAQFIGSNFTRSELYGIHADRADFMAATLKEAKLHGADLGSAELRLANFSNAQLYATKIRRFAATKINPNRMPDTDVSGLARVNLSEAEKEALLALVRPYDSTFSLNETGLRCIEKNASLLLDLGSRETLLLCPKEGEIGSQKVDRYSRLIAAFPQTDTEQSNDGICNTFAVRQILLSEFDERLFRVPQRLIRIFTSDSATGLVLRDLVKPLVAAIRGADTKKCPGAVHYRQQNFRELSSIEGIIRLATE
ncbi:MAG: pentapeptide repeat-containing protein [Ferrovibrio sp.]|uniref:pentapeptide repeat-containing protein n=1 Tax=Ferrovibrio sp. TaxID=1917215 RepID=UPI00261D6E32|nr:pentapeptide repeat-containing protein [Ferrovibrio sp.]MCW0235479.1 pentapeptide repeat-containing protein [Ferrovibrio sp.]